jgi:putative component of membrane protein insertase Oxa1/YidC/SpoIIIJ protein YidD
MFRIFILTIFISGCSFAQNKMKAPPNEISQQNMEKYGAGSNQFLNLYQKWLSPVKGGDTCPMVPSCSQYAKIVFDKFPFYRAYPKTMERILRCGHSLYLYKMINTSKRVRWYDPVKLTQSDEND